MNILFLDDMDVRHQKARRVLIGHSITHVYTAGDAMALLCKRRFDVVCLDHDLEEEHYAADDLSALNTGTAVAQYMASQMPDFLKPRQVIIHSCNPAGADRMKSILDEAGFWVVKKPFTQW